MVSRRNYAETAAIAPSFERLTVNSSKSKVRNKSRVTGGAVLFASGLALSGCVGVAPTYGTGKPADAQLMEDVTSMFSIAPQKQKNIDYKPRPELVKPGEGAATALPAPQDNIVTASANGAAWPESPEQRRERIRKTATENRDSPDFEPEVAMAASPEGPQSDSSRRGRGLLRATRGTDANMETRPQGNSSQREDFNQRLAQTQQGSSTSRRFLSEPPLDYRQPAESAAKGDVGEDEWKKEQRRKAGYTKKEKRSWWPF